MMKILNRALTHDEVRGALDDDGYVSGVVRVTLHDIIESNGIDVFCDVLSNALIGDELLMDIGYTVVGNDGNTLLIEVVGDPSESLGCDGDECAYCDNRGDLLERTGDDGETVHLCKDCAGVMDDKDDKRQDR